METTDQVTGQAAAGVANPSTPTSAQAPAQESPVEQKYVTKEELDQIMAESIRRIKQSDRDRMKQIDGKLDAMRTRLESGGSQLTQQQVNVLREQIEQDVDGGSPVDPPRQGTPVQQAQPALTPEMQAQADYVYAQLDATFADAGMTVTVQDPEWKAINDVLVDPGGSLAKLIRVAGKQAEAKAARVAGQQETAAARVVSGGQDQISGNVNASSANDYWRNAYRK